MPGKLLRGRSGGLLLVAAFCFASCGSVPIMVPDLVQSPATPVRLEGAGGTLSAGQSQAVLDGLNKPRGVSGDLLEQHLAVEETFVDSPLTVGNQVRLLQDGPATYRAMLAAIASARDHIHLETYILDDDEVGRHFAQALVAKQRSGVQVRLLRDGVGTIRTPKAFFDELAASGVQVVEFNPVNPLEARKGWELNQRDHRKLLIVDGRIAFLGGINISSVYSSGSSTGGSRAASRPGPAWRDTDLQVQGPVVAELQKLFLAQWASQNGKPPAGKKLQPAPAKAGSDIARAIGSSPEEPYSQIYVTLLSAIAHAQRSVRLTNAYFAPDPQLLAALSDAARRGVEVTLILPGQTDSWLVFHAGRSYYEQLLDAGVKIYERRDVILHAKTALIDGVWATVGSTNLDWRSFIHNHELNVVVLGADFGQQLQAMFDKDLAASDAITLADWHRRPLDLRIKELFGRAWAYWL